MHVPAVLIRIYVPLVPRALIQVYFNSKIGKNPLFLFTFEFLVVAIAVIADRLETVKHKILILSVNFILLKILSYHLD